MKWLAALLLVANAIFYLWAGGESGAHQANLAKPDVNSEGMLLLNEAEARAGGGQAAADGGQSCFRIGPFRERNGWRAAEKWLRAQKFPYRAVRDEGREIREVRVFLGPFDSAAAVRPVTEWLQEKEIDHITDSGGGENTEARISLGAFTQRKLAEKFTAHLLAEGIEAKS